MRSTIAKAVLLFTPSVFAQDSSIPDISSLEPLLPTGSPSPTPSASAGDCSAETCLSDSLSSCPTASEDNNFNASLSAFHGCICSESFLSGFSGCSSCPSVQSLDLGTQEQLAAYCDSLGDDLAAMSNASDPSYNAFQDYVLDKANEIDGEPAIAIYPDVRDKLGSWVIAFVRSKGIDAFTSNYTSIFTWVQETYSSAVSTLSSDPSLSESLAAPSGSNGSDETPDSTSDTASDTASVGNSTASGSGNDDGGWAVSLSSGIPVLAASCSALLIAGIVQLN